jgi:hypothetical protein
MKHLLLAAAGALTAAIMVPGANAAPSADGYLHSIAVPPRCAFPWQSPTTDPVCSDGLFAPRLATTSQSVILGVSDFEGSLADCQGYVDAQTTVFTIDGSPVPITIQPCREVTQSVPNLLTLPIDGVNAVWAVSYRALIPAGSLSPGDYSFSWTITFTSDYTYALGCTDPSGRCLGDAAGTVLTNTNTLTIAQ